ncbi:MAG: HD domain-containing protein [Acidobacteria bacterium]|nr:HD domain-containing protein [Acidobacteriota bacterium]
MKQIRLLYVILAVMLLASVGPLIFYASKTMEINRRALETNEILLQNTITRSIAEEIAIYRETFNQMLDNMDGMLNARSDLVKGQNQFQNPQLRSMLEQVVGSSTQVIYATMLDAQGKGIQAGNYNIESDLFLVRTLERGFTAAQQRRQFQSDPVIVNRGQELFPAMLVSRPIIRDDQFQGMTAVVLNLQFLVERLRSSSTSGLHAFIVDNTGRLVLTPNVQDQSVGQSMENSPIVKMFLSWKGNVKGAETSEFNLGENGEAVPMVGTYWPVQSVGWAVIAQKKRDDAYSAVREVISATTSWAVVALLMCIGLSYGLSLWVVRPIRVLTEASRAIAQGDFSKRIELRNRTEIGEMAATFNHMTADLELYVDRLKTSAEQNRQLFMESIRMIAAAVDEKDPYTHGHSERVSRYSVLIARHLEMPEEEVDRVRISALLHDIGKIGIEDKILKKPGMLTPEEFAIMKQHPQKGAAIANRVAQLREMVPGIELHHEWLDGRGYPYGLKGDDIPLMACIISVADTFDAMTTHRPYQTAMEPSVAIEYIRSCAGQKFNADATAALETVYGSGLLKVQRAAALV